ncbi:hypothetical protein RIF29_38482 [Crotalaria pallida]|uniref:DUF4283 domain-containing protein n=1 Tax=Crotalaria pallida TaxID=3830 RepID=A0AAN9DZD9_CROPI
MKDVRLTKGKPGPERLDVSRRGRLTYAQVVGQNSTQQKPDKRRQECSIEIDPDWKGMTVRIDPKEWEWLKGSFVGKVREIGMIEDIKEALEAEGFTTINPLPMGGDLVLLKPVEGEDFKEILKDSEELLSNWFVYVKPWDEEDIAGYRISWLRCAGIPLHAWNDTFFKTLVSKFGTFLKADTETRERTKLDVARIQVKTSTQGFINIVQRIMINGRIFGVRIMEECLVQDNTKKQSVDEVDKKSNQDTSCFDSFSDDSLEDKHKGVLTDFSDEWVPDSMELKSPSMKPTVSRKKTNRLERIFPR